MGLRDREAARAYGRAYYHRNKDKYREWEKNRNKEHKRAYDSARHKANRASMSETEIAALREYQRAWKQKNKDRVLAHREANQEKAAEQARLWVERNRERVRGYVSNRRARLRGADGTIRDRDWLRLVNHHRGLCAYCGQPGVTREHVVPLTRGGRHTIGNVLPVCLSCNSSKNNRLLIEWSGRPRMA